MPHIATVLVDGYLRVAAIRALGRDVATAVCVDVGEVDALIMAHHRLDETGRRSALEGGWPLDELMHRHGQARRAWQVSEPLAQLGMPSPGPQAAHHERVRRLQFYARDLQRDSSAPRRGADHAIAERIARTNASTIGKIVLAQLIVSFWGSP